MFKQKTKTVELNSFTVLTNAINECVGFYNNGPCIKEYREEFFKLMDTLLNYWNYNEFDDEKLRIYLRFYARLFSRITNLKHESKILDFFCLLIILIILLHSNYLEASYRANCNYM